MDRSYATAGRWSRVLLLVAGLMLIGYAISDHPLYGGEPGFGRVQALIAAVGAAFAACAALPPRFGERVLLIAITSLIMLGLAELAAAVVLKPALRPIYQADDRLIFKFIPDRVSVMRRLPVNGGDLISHRINRDGFRGAELLPPGTATRVVVYGDSFIHASYTAEEETFAAVLGRQLTATTGRPVEVVNAGVSSYGPDQISLKMQDELPRLQPDLVLVAIFAGNDYGDLMRNKLFRLATDGSLVANPWQLDPGIRRKFELSQRESLLLRALRSTLGARRPAADRHGNEQQPGDGGFSDWDFLLKEAENEYRSVVVEGNNVVTNTHVDYYSADVSLTPHSASARYKVALMQATLRRIAELARDRRVPLAFLFIPHPNDVANRYDWGPVDRSRYPDYDRRNLIAPLEAGARALGVPFVSLHDAYRSRDAGALYFHGGDDHWNAAGQQLAAQLAAEALGPLLAPGPGRVSP